MAQACTPTVIVMDGCGHCSNLESMLNSAGIVYKTTTSGGCGCYPCAVLCNGSTVTSCGGNAEYDVFNAIKASIAVSGGSTSQTGGTTSTKVTKPAETDTTVTVDDTPAWRVAIWSNEVTINWGEPNKRPTIKETPVDWQHPDVQLTPVLPLPPQMTTGITVALRDHKKMPKGRKVA